MRKRDKVCVLPPRGSTEKGDQRLWRVRSLERENGKRLAQVELMAADEPERTVPLLRQALGLVRGRPFQDIPAGSYSWVGLDRLDSDMSASIAEAAGTLVAAALAANDAIPQRPATGLRCLRADVLQSESRRCPAEKSLGGELP